MQVGTLHFVPLVPTDLLTGELRGQGVQRVVAQQQPQSVSIPNIEAAQVGRFVAMQTPAVRCAGALSSRLSVDAA